MGKIIGLTFDATTPAAPVKEGDKYICPVCGKEYKTAKALADHIKSKHPDYTPENAETGETGGAEE